jgi:hypothetical protein
MENKYIAILNELRRSVGVEYSYFNNKSSITACAERGMKLYSSSSPIKLYELMQKHNIDDSTYRLVKAWYDASTRHTKLSKAHGIVISATILPIITHPDFRVWINGVVIYKSGGRSCVSSEQLANFIKTKNIQLLVRQAEQNSIRSFDVAA